MSKVMQQFPSRESFKPELDGANSSIKEVKEESARRLKAAEAAKKGIEERVRELMELASAILSFRSGYAWPVERRECDDGTVALVIEVQEGRLCTCCPHKIGVTPMLLHRLGVDKVIVRDPMVNGRPRMKVAVVDYRVEQDRIVYPNDYNCCRFYGDEEKDREALRGDRTLPEFPGLLEWEFYDPDPTSAP